jgi:hypothetical protein
MTWHRDRKEILKGLREDENRAWDSYVAASKQAKELAEQWRSIRFQADDLEHEINKAEKSAVAESEAENGR